MLKPTITKWEDRFDDKFNFYIDKTSTREVKQFIADLRQSDKEALIKLIYEELQPFDKMSGLEKAIKNYYNN